MVFAEKLKRPSALAFAALLLLASLVPLFAQQKAGAYGLLTSREIRMSSSASGAVAAGQDVIYLVRATTASTSNIGGMVVEFCSNSPIIGDSCTAPTGFTLDPANLVIANQTGVGANNFSVDTTNSTASKLVLTRTVASITNGTAVTFELGNGGTNGVTNPTNSNTTFYARILTYTTAAGAQGYTSASPGAEPPLVDAGGIALSTSAQITVTSKVQERLTFCVYTDGNNDATLGDANYTSCSGVGGTAITLGDTNGVLSDTGAYVDKNTMYNVSTNASSGVAIRVKGATLTSGSFTIDASGTAPGNGTEQASTTGDEQFGFCTYMDAGGGAGLAPDLNYDGASGAPAGECAGTTQTAGTGSTGGDNSALFNFDLTTACGSTASATDFGANNLSCRYGDTIATKPAGGQSTGRVVFIGNIATTTEPGIYTSTLTFIATGIY